MYRIILISLICCLSGLYSGAQPVSLVSTPKPVYKIPFRLTGYNSIVIRAAVNRTDTVNLMLHTASSDVTLTEDAIKKLHTLKFKEQVDSVKSWGGNNNTSGYSTGNTFNIGDLGWRDVTIWEDKHSGQETDGKFGLNFFDKKVLEFDFDNNLLIISNRVPEKIKSYTRLALQSKGDNLLVKGTCVTGSIFSEASFLLHTGYAGAVLLDDAFVSKTKLNQRIKITGQKNLKDAYGNMVIAKKGIMPALKFQHLLLQNIPVGFFEAAIGRQKMSILGGDVLKRFNFIIDADRAYIYLKPNLLFNTSYLDI